METQEGGGRIGQDFRTGSRPDGGGHRQEVIVPESSAIAAGREIVAKRHAGPAPREHVARRVPIEAGDVLQHRPEARAHQIAALGEKTGQAGATIFEPAFVQRHGEGHLGRLRRDAKMVHQRNEVRICRLVVDDETGIDRRLAAASGDTNRVGVAAEARSGLEQHHVVSPPQQPCRRETGDAGTNHRDPHRLSLRGLHHRISACHGGYTPLGPDWISRGRTKKAPAA